MRNEKIIPPGMGCPTLRTLPMMVSQAPVLTAPGFLAMMEEVGAGRVGAIVIKDMRRLGRSGSPHRLALLCRLRWQDVCPPHQQWQEDFSIYLFQLYQSSVWDTMPYITPYQ